MKKLIFCLALLTSMSSFAETQSERVSDALKEDLKITKKLLKSFGKSKEVNTHTSEAISGEYFLWTTVEGQAYYSNGHVCKTRVVSTARTPEQDFMKGMSVRCYNAQGIIYLDTFDPGIAP